MLRHLITEYSSFTLLVTFVTLFPQCCHSLAIYNAQHYRKNLRFAAVSFLLIVNIMVNQSVDARKDYWYLFKVYNMC